jgi:DNA-binding transcriptional ArsR family regulator
MALDEPRQVWVISTGVYVSGVRPSETRAIKDPNARTNVPTPAHIRSTIATLTSPPEDLRAVATYHKARADPTRLRLLQRLADRPATVTELIDVVDLSQPLVSWHLHRLKAAGLVDTRRSGREVICTISRDALDYFQARDRELLGLVS